MNHSPRILVAGIGNIFLDDNAFGVEVVKRLAAKRLPPGVEVVDFGIRGLDLTYALLDGYDAAIMVDAAPRGQPPGTLYVVEPKAEEAHEDDSIDDVVETHSLDPVKVLRLLHRMGGRVDRLLLVGCEPLPLDADNVHQGLSVAVAAAVDEAVRMIQVLIEKVLEKYLVTHGGSPESAEPAKEREFHHEHENRRTAPHYRDDFGHCDRHPYRGLDRAGLSCQPERCSPVSAAQADVARRGLALVSWGVLATAAGLTPLAPYSNFEHNWFIRT